MNKKGENKTIKHLKNISYLSQGEHSLEEVLRLAGLSKKPPRASLEGRYCPICGKEVEIVEEEDNDPVNGFQVWRKAICPIHGTIR